MSRLPPVGTYVPFSAALAPFGAAGDAAALLERDLAGRFGGESAVSFRSGRAALAVFLRALSEDRGAKGVIVPAYTCFSVPSALTRAGLLAYPIDVSPATLDFDFHDQTDAPPPEVFAAVSPGLFGFPPDLARLERAAARDRIFLIEDAAQTMGAMIDGRAAGSFGDASLLSFGRGKPVGGQGGGVLIAHTRAVAEMLTKLRQAPARRSRFASGASAAAAWLSIRPEFFAIVRLLPFVTLGASVFDPGLRSAVSTRDAPPWCGVFFPEFEALVARRRETAGQLTAGLRGLPGLILPAPRSGIQSSWLRFPAIFEDAGDRDAALYRLTTKGLGASTMYPVPVHKIPQAAEMVRGDFGPFPGAEKIARGLVTLPTHGAVRRRHGDEIIKIVRETLGAGT